MTIRSWNGSPLRRRALAAAGAIVVFAATLSGGIYTALGGDPVAIASGAARAAVSNAAQTVASLFARRSPGARGEALLSNTKPERVALAGTPVAAAAPLLPGVTVIEAPPPAVPFAFYSPPIELLPGWVGVGLPTIGGEVSPPLAPGGVIPPYRPDIVVLPPGTSPPGVMPPVTPPSLVPEPQTWALMVIGFGLLGATLRRRRMRSAFLSKA